jgi:hypothetical protein
MSFSDKAAYFSVEKQNSTPIWHVTSTIQQPGVLVRPLIDHLNASSQPVSTGTIVFAILFGVIFLVGIVTNACVVLLFIVKSEIRQYTNYLFANLSIADLFVITVCIPVAITDLFSPDVWQYGLIFCKFKSIYDPNTSCWVEGIRVLKVIFYYSRLYIRLSVYEIYR